MARSSWTEQIPSAELQVIHDWIDSGAEYRAADLYRHLNMARYCRPRTWRQYVQRRRRRRQAQEESGRLPPSSFSPQSLEQLTLDAIGQALLQGTIPEYRLHSILTAIQRLKLVELRRQIHEEARAALRRELEARQATGREALAIGEVVDLVDRVMRGEAA